MYLSSSNTSCMFERGTITVLIPEPAAASIFAVTPPYRKYFTSDEENIVQILSY